MDYYYHTPRGETSGPLPREVLEEWIRLGQLPTDLPVCAVGSQRWLPAEQAFGIRSATRPAAIPAARMRFPANGSYLPYIKVVLGAAVLLLLIIVWQDNNQPSAPQPMVPAEPQPKPPAPPTTPEQRPQTNNWNRELTHAIHEYYGINCPTDIRHSISVFEAAAKQEDPAGMLLYAMVMNVYDNKDESNIGRRGHQALLSTPNQYSREIALCHAAIICRQCWGIALQDEVLKDLLDCAQKGDCLAQCLLGSVLADCVNACVNIEETEKARAEAVRFLNLSAQNGCSMAYFHLGVLLGGEEGRAAWQEGVRQGNELCAKKLEH